MKKREKSPLEGFKDRFDAMSPKEKAAWQKKMSESIKETRKRLDAEEEEKKKPPKTPEGVCGVCGGLVAGEYVHGMLPGYNSMNVPLGPGGKHCYGWIFKGYHCRECGLMYKFPPKPKK